jgi:hypothetical protein
VTIKMGHKNRAIKTRPQKLEKEREERRKERKIIQ